MLIVTNNQINYLKYLFDEKIEKTKKNSLIVLVLCFPPEWNSLKNVYDTCWVNEWNYNYCDSYDLEENNINLNQKDLNPGEWFSIFEDFYTKISESLKNSFSNRLDELFEICSKKMVPNIKLQTKIFSIFKNSKQIRDQLLKLFNNFWGSKYFKEKIINCCELVNSGKSVNSLTNLMKNSLDKLLFGITIFFFQKLSKYHNDIERLNTIKDESNPEIKLFISILQKIISIDENNLTDKDYLKIEEYTKKMDTFTVKTEESFIIPCIKILFDEININFEKNILNEKNFIKLSEIFNNIFNKINITIKIIEDNKNLKEKFFNDFFQFYFLKKIDNKFKNKKKLENLKNLIKFLFLES